MTKKKNSRQKHQNDIADTSEEEQIFLVQGGKSCQHVMRGIHFGRVKKTLKSSQNVLICNGCSNENDSEELPEIWLCLQCGYKGCGRSSENKHALQHFKTIHSDCHSLVLSTSSGVVWCYDCDSAVNLQSSQILKQCVDFVMKMAPGNSNKIALTNGVIDAKGQDLVIKEEIPVQKFKEKEPGKNIEKSIKSAALQTPNSKPLIKGLRNLGNTCFFNAVMQNLNQTQLLCLEVKDTCTPTHLWEIPDLEFSDNDVTVMENADSLKLSLPRQLPLTNSLLNFFDQMNAKSTVKIDIVNPSPLFGEISKKCPQFRHFQEQDSHELLRQLLDNIRQEEIKRQKKAILKHFQLENVTPEDVDDDMKKRCKAYAYYASHTIIEKVFGGLLISTVLCEECKMSSQIFEPFMDLSLPLFEEKPLRNKKSDIEEDIQGEYILPKPKHDPGKPSKHQEKKLKQQAKREKKKGKNSKNRKNSLNETSYDAPNTSEANNQSIANEEIGNDSGDEETSHNDQIIENQKHSDKTFQNGEVFEIQSNIADDGGKENGCESSSIHQSYQHSENILCDPSINLFEKDVNSKDDSQDFVIQNSECQLMDTDKMPQESTADACNDIAESGFADDGMPLETDDVELNFDLKEDKSPSKPTEDTEELSVISEQSDIVQDLTSSFKKCCISSEFYAEDRIQALSMQIKDVRIRRDSDRQEMLLNSSESADENESQRTNCTSPKSSIEDSCSVENGDNWSHAVSEQQTKEWILKSLTTLQPRHNVFPNECSINSCLSHFTKPELLTGNNKFRCENCTEIKVKRTGNKKEIVYSNASKQILIFSPPAILTLHMKRFQQVGMSLRKVNRFVEFPLILDLAPFCSSACVILPHMTTVDDEILYSLYGIVEHSGRLSSGHYTAYVKASKRTADRIFECQVPLGQCNLEQLLQKYSGESRASLGACSKTENDEKRQWFYISDSHVKEVSEAQVLKCQAYLLFYERIK